MVVTTVIFRRLCRGLAKRSLLVKNAAPFARFSPHALVVDDASFPGYIRPWAEREQQHRKFIFGALLIDDGRSRGGAGVDSGTTSAPRYITSADIIGNIPASRIVIICFTVCSSAGIHDKKSYEMSLAWGRHHFNQIPITVYVSELTGASPGNY